MSIRKFTFLFHVITLHPSLSILSTNICLSIICHLETPTFYQTLAGVTHRKLLVSSCISLSISHRRSLSLLNPNNCLSFNLSTAPCHLETYQSLAGVTKCKLLNFISVFFRSLSTFLNIFSYFLFLSLSFLSFSSVYLSPSPSLFLCHSLPLPAPLNN